jgi:predicted TIM-barrel fold metal-dependent hydrolase
MGRIPLAAREAAQTLRTWKEQPGMIGVRITFLRAQAAWLSDGSADWFWPAAERAGVPVMVLAANMAALGPIAERHPQLTLIVDHMGISGEALRQDRRAAAVADTIALAKHPNVSVKLSSAPAYTTQGYPFADMTPLIRGCFDAYGPQRCYWGADITNSLAKASYRQRIAHFTQELDFLSEDDKDWIMGRAIVARLGLEQARG